MLKVVVLEKIKKNWDIGSVVSVKNGFARNYLIPTGKAKIATKDNIEDIMKKKASLEEKDKEFIKNQEVISEKINGLTFTKEIAAKDNGELFGSISIGDISSFLLEQGISVEKKMIKLGEKIKTSGNHKVDIDLHPEISCSLNIDILSPKSSL
ncbi:MAG: 50S ribosomal protein L9 [Alphaproteobacteria bacterium]|jgi:large subunit ribosomal protein L9|tara:strand:+ start:359 stop:817 length:459 start_codon:yes stop_codon:yes gene_type:complete